MTHPTFPLIPEMESGQVFSAAIMRYTHKAAIEYLLGESHASFAVPHVRTPSTDVYQSEYQTIWELLGYHASHTLYYKLAVKINYGNAIDREWHYRIQVSPDLGATWYTAREATGTDNTYQDEDGAVDLSAVADGGGGFLTDHLNVGGLYKWRLQVKCGNMPDPADCTVHLVPWGIGTRKAVSGWAAPPTFAAGASDAADANVLRADANALYAALPQATPGTAQPWYTIVSFTETWTELSRVAYRYRGDQLRVAVAASGWGNETWQWRASLQDEAGNSAVIHTSAEIWGDEALDADAYAWDTATVTLTAGDAATAIAAAGITLTAGEWYRVVVEIYTTASPGRVWGFGTRVDRLSSGALGGDYAVPHLWAHGDTDIGPTNLNVYSDDLTALYSGSEALGLDVPFVDVVENSAGVSLVHRKRYLYAFDASGASIRYGAGYATTYSLTDAADAWGWVDLEAVGVPYGAAYWVSGVSGAVESDAVTQD